jgi:serpin B
MKCSLLVLAVCLGALSWGEAAPTEQTPVQVVERGMDLFGYKWCKEQSKDSENENMITSVLSTGLVMAMASFGAQGDTKTQIRKALDMPESDDIVKTGMKSYMTAYEKPRKAEIKTANKIFTNTGFEMKQEFKDVTKDSFNSEAQMLDFKKSEEASKTINDWAEEKTNNKIKNLVAPGNFFCIQRQLYLPELNL